MGNVEGDDLTGGAAEVVVTDGFTGNVALKTMEGTARTVVGAIRDAVRSGPVSTVGGLLIRGKVGALRRQLDPNAVGGAILLGLRRPVVIAHGASTAEGVASAVLLAQARGGRADDRADRGGARCRRRLAIRARW